MREVQQAEAAAAVCPFFRRRAGRSQLSLLRLQLRWAPSRVVSSACHFRAQVKSSPDKPLQATTNYRRRRTSAYSTTSPAFVRGKARSETIGMTLQGNQFTPSQSIPHRRGILVHPRSAGNYPTRAARGLPDPGTLGEAARESCRLQRMIRLRSRSDYSSSSEKQIKTSSHKALEQEETQCFLGNHSLKKACRCFGSTVLDTSRSYGALEVYALKDEILNHFKPRNASWPEGPDP